VKKSLLLFGLLFTISAINAQIITPKFGSGIKFMGKDSSYYMKVGLRFQNLVALTWDLEDEEEGFVSDFNALALVRRSRLKFDGWAVNQRLKYKLELSLSNRDNGGGGNLDEFGNAANIILDAFVQYQFYKNFTIKFGQGKLAGNRERVISSGNLQFVDRSRLNSRFNIDRDVFIQLGNTHTLGKEFIIRTMASISLGEGKNQITGYNGGFDFTYRAEFLPFGKFESKGDYIGSSIKRETTPKLSLGVTWDNNQFAIRERGQLGDFISDANGTNFGKDLNTFFVDCMFKYQGFSFMGEYARKTTEDDDPFVFDEEGNQIGEFYTGSAINLAMGYMFENNIEFALRYTEVNADEATDEEHYTVGLNKFFVGHKLKLQIDFSYVDREDSQDFTLLRTQVDIHF